MNSRRIVLVMIEPPLPFGNAAARWFYILFKGLVERGYRVTGFATCSQAGDLQEAQALFPAPTFDLRCYEHPARGGLLAKCESFRRPFSYMFSRQFCHDLEAELARGFDVLHLEQLWSGWLGLRHTSKALVNLHYLFSIDLAHEAPTSFRERALRAVTCRAERRLLQSYPTIVTLTDRLSNRVRQLAPSANVHTVPLGLDIGLYPFYRSSGPGTRPVVGLVGSFQWPPTYSAGVRLLTRLWPEIKRRVPEARLQVVGRQARQALGRFAGVADLSLHEDVANTAPYFHSTDVMLYAPVAGSGMKVKVLEAFALGTPVVTTEEGIEGIPAKDGVHAGVCEDDAGLIERAVRLLKDHDARERQRRAARALLESHCAPQPTLDAMEKVYATLVG